jgi:hypothetical protein
MRQNLFTTAFLIALWLLTPDVLCLVPGVDLTMDEHECCKRMGEQCGVMPVPEFHKCCQKVIPSDALVASKATAYPEGGMTALPAIHPPPGLTSELTGVRQRLRLENPPPPALLSAEFFDILRI